MSYTMKCPYCKMFIKGSGGSPVKRIDTPIQKCPRCFRSYIDQNAYEWSVLNPIYKVWYYFFANNRIFVWFILLGYAYNHFLHAVVAAIAWAALCVVSVQIVNKKRMIASKERTSNPQYMAALVKSDYDKLGWKYDP